MRHANGSYDIRLPKDGYNIFREINETSNKTKNLSASLIATMSINILENLSFEGLASYGYVTNTSDNINGKSTYAAVHLTQAMMLLHALMDLSHKLRPTIQTITYAGNYITSIPLPKTIISVPY